METKLLNLFCDYYYKKIDVNFIEKLVSIIMTEYQLDDYVNKIILSYDNNIFSQAGYRPIEKEIVIYVNSINESLELEKNIVIFLV